MFAACWTSRVRAAARFVARLLPLLPPPSKRFWSIFGAQKPPLFTVDAAAALVKIAMKRKPTQMAIVFGEKIRIARKTRAREQTARQLNCAHYRRSLACDTRDVRRYACKRLGCRRIRRPFLDEIGAQFNVNCYNLQREVAAFFCLQQRSRKTCPFVCKVEIAKLPHTCDLFVKNIRRVI